MASYFNLLLDTLAPASPSILINDDDVYTTSLTVTLTLATGDEDTTGYQMKIWGIEGAATETAAEWETFTGSKTVTIPDGDGLKTIYAKFRDDVGNETAVISDKITLDTSVPTVSVTGPDKAKISKIVGYNVAVINFMSDVAFKNYKVCVVPSASSTVGVGTVIGETNGSVNTSGEKDGGNDLYPADTNIEVQINGADLEEASSGDGVKIVKVFVQNDAGTWSVA